MSPLDAHFAGLDIFNRQVAVIGKLEQEVGRLERELAAIRLAFPEDHPARKEGSIADGVRGLVFELHSLKYEADGQLRANLSNDAIGSMLDTAKGYMQQRDSWRELLRELNLPELTSLSMITDEQAQRITAALGTHEGNPKS